MIEVKNLSKAFKSGDSTVKAVDNVSLKVDEGAFVSIVGPSGSGKTTLMSLLGALDKPNSGSVQFDGQDITKLKDRSLVTYRAKNVGFVFQGYNLVPNLTAIENVMLPMEFIGTPKDERRQRAAKLLDEVGLDAGKQRRKPGRLSGGEQQRVAIARALANHPKLILADEPTGNLDSETGKIIFKGLHNIAKLENTTVIVVTHDLSIAGKTDAMFRLSDGKLVK
ncbi:MAG TPA: ABC transporter ATP-binding protein [Candidatus Saccharimonadales bacterium]|nr:ABC transporter ATP-binding protein [Candidatus Saccharimonadales bacterium]